ncbi:MAG: sigma-70 family RNA polymerase sigma factor [Emcibacter sp.]|nr:sigma-70 family RNA polymerase sigma factor [Emcibacter sp.]
MMIEEPKQDINYYIQSYYGELMAFVLGRIHSRTSAADIVQETFLRFLSNKDKKSVQNPRAYLYRIAGNLVIDESRKHAAQGEYIVQDAILKNIKDTVIHGEQVLEGRQRLRFMAIAIEELPPRCRQVFRMRKVELRPVEDIMESLGISRNMVEKHLRRALIHCRHRVVEMELGKRN